MSVDVRLRSQRFRDERQADWRRLEWLMQKAEKKSAAKLTDEELLALPVLYRSTLSALSVARETSLDQSLIAYLETLSSRAYFFVYGSRARPGEQILSFFRSQWSGAVRALWRETLAAIALIVLGALLAARLTAVEIEWFHAFVPPEMANGRGPSASTQSLAATLGGGSKGLAVFAAFLFTHNAQIALLAFALGIGFCLPTLVLLLYNGATLGAMASLFAARGLGWEFGGWIAIHGVTELFAVALAGAAGLHIGWAAAFPGLLSRRQALAKAGRTAGTAMAGVILMLLVAGLLEGFCRQLIVSAPARYAVGAASGLVWLIYFYRPGFGRRARVNA